MQTDEEMSERPGTFLAMVPRGLESSISLLVQEKISDAKISMLGGGQRPSEEIGAEARDALLAQQRKKNRSPNPWFIDGAVGSVMVSKSSHISVGYTDSQSCTWSVAGTLEGTVWMKIETKQIEKMSSLRCLGPLLSLVATSDIMPALTDPKHSMADMLAEFSRWIASIGEDVYHKQLESSLDLWKNYARGFWRTMLSEADYADLQDRIQNDTLRFRLSCMRDHVDASYARQDFLTELMGELGPTLIPYYYDKSAARGWKVNLKQFDVEFVIITLSNGFMAIGISMLPYSFYNAKSFSSSVIPPDISKPYLGHESMEGLVRLRPSTAHMLVQMARLQPFETVLDPCAGIGTIPLEADVFFSSCVGLGGDVTLNHPIIATTASSMEQVARGATLAPSSLLAAWDAAHLPIRDASVDVCISDLPFGKQCLSTNQLRQLLPLLFLECARTLVRNEGRMVMLCGTPTITDSMSESQLYWTQPCTIATPVTVGGLGAWILRIERNDVAYDPKRHPRKLDRVRTLTKRRDMLSRHQNPNDVGNTKKRRIQR